VFDELGTAAESEPLPCCRRRFLRESLLKYLTVRFRHVLGVEHAALDQLAVVANPGSTGVAKSIGFNLPFDLSRVAIAHTYAQGSMKGGFSFTLGEDRPNVRVKHLSQKAALE